MYTGGVLKKTDMKHSRYRHILNHVGVGFVAIVLFGLVGAHYNQYSSAATATYSHNPQADTDYCALVGSSTVLYGWAADADAPAGASPYVRVGVSGGVLSDVPSDIAGYRDTAINNYIKVTNPGAPTSSVYGWRLQLSGLYKGGSYVVSGTVLNYGTGTNVALPVNNDHYVDGDSSKTYFNSNNTIPDNCLLARPVAPAPTPSPAPVTVPVRTPTKTSTPTTPEAVAAATSAADATVTVGTTAVALNVPAGGATSLYLRYGSSAGNLDRSSDIQTLTGDSATVLLTKLDASTTYSYQIVRTIGTETPTSPNATFTTKGFDIALAFTDHAGKPIPSIKVTLKGSKDQTTDKSGKVVFKDLADGSYSPIFSYGGQTYSEDFNTNSAKAEDGTSGVTMSQTVDVSLLSTAKSTAVIVPQKKSGLPTVILVLLLLAAGVFAFWWLLRRKRRRLAAEMASAYTTHASSTPAPAVRTPQQYNPRPIPTAPAAVVATAALKAHKQQSKAMPAPTPAPTHMGESLRDMVIKSMAEEAAKHPNNHTNRPIVPGQK